VDHAVARSAPRNDDTDDDRFFGELATTFGRLQHAFARHVGVSRPRLQVLMRLWRSGETSHRDLRHLLSADGASVTRLVKEFEADGLVSRRMDPDDNRYTLARLTPAGERTAAALAGAHRTYQEQLLDGITADEREIVLESLRRLAANIDGIERRRGATSAPGAEESR
jgi:DNA-binding MarR family transcriptional regulator